MYNDHPTGALTLAQLKEKTRIDDPEENLFSSEDIDESTNTIRAHDCEQLIFALAADSATLILDNSPYEFQKNVNFREGFGHPIVVDCASVECESVSNVAIIQGVQVSGSIGTGTNIRRSAIYCPSNGIVRPIFKRIYFKDWVFTKTGAGAFFAALSNTPYATFDNCLISIHIRAGEYGALFDDSPYVQWHHCARYIEYSDVDDSTIGNSPAICFVGTTSECSTIIRNLSWNDGLSSQQVSFLGNSTNSSWDIEFYTVHRGQRGTSVVAWQTIRITNVNNCFFSLKSAEIINESPDDNVDWITFSSTAGVNVYNKGNADDTDMIALTATHDSNVKQLTEDECKNAAILNKWGFFVNTVS